MLINEEFKKIVQQRYDEAKNSGKTSISIDEKLGGIELFINEKPVFSLSKFTIDDDTVYIGANEIIPTS